MPNQSSQLSALTRAFSNSAASYDAASVLHQQVGQHLAERLAFFVTQPNSIVDVGCNTGRDSLKLAEQFPDATVLALDCAWPMLVASRARCQQNSSVTFAQADMMQLPLLPNQVDLVYANLVFQWADDLEPLLRLCHSVLKPGGTLLFSTYGPDTLHECRASWVAVDDTPHVNQFYDMHDIGDMLVRAGFAEPVLDVDRLTLTYPSVTAFCQEQQAIGSNVILAPNKRRSLTGKNRFQQMIANYEAQYQLANGRIPVTFEVVYAQAFATASGPAQERAADGSVSVPLTSLQYPKN